MADYFNKNNLFSLLQSGFRKDYTTATVLIIVYYNTSTVGTSLPHVRDV